MFFSWRKILRKSGRSSNKVVLILKALCKTSLPKNKWDPLYEYYYTDFSGDSYLLQPYELSDNAFRWKPLEIAQYIGLASLRNYAEYSVSGDASLDLFHSPVSEDTINNNRLLKISNGRIYFYYEEVTKRRNKLWH